MDEGAGVATIESDVIIVGGGISGMSIKISEISILHAYPGR